jgi:hypothetical protein
MFYVAERQDLIKLGANQGSGSAFPSVLLAPICAPLSWVSCSFLIWISNLSSIPWMASWVNDLFSLGLERQGKPFQRRGADQRLDRTQHDGMLAAVGVKDIGDRHTLGVRCWSVEQLPRAHFYHDMGG